MKWGKEIEMGEKNRNNKIFKTGPSILAISINKYELKL